jgi:HSF-type DNA-binding
MIIVAVPQPSRNMSLLDSGSRQFTCAGKIEVHSPHKLEAQVLNRYFRHSKFASFQRQLNYFGFRSYVNDSTTGELGSLLLVKVR